MSAAGPSLADAAAERLTAAADRTVRIWRHLPSERRLAAGAACGLFLTLFLPWYQETVIARGVTSLRSVSASLTGWAAFSWVEAVVLLVAAGVLVLLIRRAEGRAFQVPGGDGGVITAAGACTCLLVIWGMFDKAGTTAQGQIETTTGIDWGIFVALAVAGLLTYTGTRIRRAPEPEPPLPGDPAPAPGAGPTSSGPGGGRIPEMDADATWTLDASSRRESRPAAAEPHRRARPSSLGLDPQKLGIADPPTSPLRPSKPPAPPPRAAEPPTERLSRSEIATERLTGSEAATVRQHRRRPPDPEADTDDQLTLRLDRGD